MKPKPKVSALDKKIAPNPKYRNVETTIDTGNNLRKKLELLEERSQLYKFRNDEVFRRVNVNNLVRLMVEQTKLEYQLEPPAARQPREGEEDERSEFADSATEELEWDTRVEEVARAVMGGSRLGTARSVVSVAQGVGELDREEQAGPAPATAARPFLLLDVREPEDWERVLDRISRRSALHCSVVHRVTWCTAAATPTPGSTGPSTTRRERC